MPTIEDVAKWMAEQVTKEGVIYQDVIVTDILARFGEQFTYINGNGNTAIAKDVLQAFKKMTANSVVWEPGSRLWRKREPYDLPGRKQP